VISMQGEKLVVVIGQDNIAAFRPVELGTLNAGMQVIRKGLAAGERVVVDGLLKVRPGEKVDPKPVPIEGQAGGPKSTQWTSATFSLIGRSSRRCSRSSSCLLVASH